MTTPDSNSLSLDQFFATNTPQPEVPEVEEQYIEPEPKKSKGRVFLRNLLWVLLVLGAAFGLYKVYTLFLDPPERELNLSAVEALEEFESQLAQGTQDAFPPGSYLGQEFSMANKNEDKELFLQKVMGSVFYDIPEQQATDTQGKVILDSSGQPKMVSSELLDGESVKLSYLDYQKLDFSPAKVRQFAIDNNFDPEHVDLVNTMNILFARYVVEQAGDPITTVEYVPTFLVIDETEEGTPVYGLSPNEDADLDQLLFSSKELYDAMDKFSKVLNPKVKVNPAWEEWSSYSPEKQAETQEPQRFDPEGSVSRDWVGAYAAARLCEEEGGTETECAPDQGDGTEDRPAALGTPVITYVLSETKKGELVKEPIRVTLKTFLEDKEAIDFLEAKDTRNRGIDVFSKVKVIALEIEIENLSKEELVIPNNISLADYNANLFATTGNMYGLTEELTLKPKEKGLIETWVSSTNPYSMFLVWGADFERREPVVWFDVLRTADCLPKECGPRGEETSQSGQELTQGFFDTEQSQ